MIFFSIFGSFFFPSIIFVMTNFCFSFLRMFDLKNKTQPWNFFRKVWGLLCINSPADICCYILRLVRYCWWVIYILLSPRFKLVFLLFSWMGVTGFCLFSSQLLLGLRLFNSQTKIPCGTFTYWASLCSLGYRFRNILSWTLMSLAMDRLELALDGY